MATNFVNASYNEIYDLSTQVGDVTTLKFHAPGSILPQRYLRGFWTQYKKYRYYGSKITMVPVATLPADPLQISYEAGEPTIDPRDMVNPILHKVYRGEALIDDANRFIDMMSGVDKTTYNTGTDPTLGENQYYATLQDPSWKKSHVQRGFRARGVPLVRKVAANLQFTDQQSSTNGYPGTQQSSQWDASVVSTGERGSPVMGQGLEENRNVMGSPSDLHGYFNGTENEFRRSATPDFSMFTSGWDKLGWLDTSQRLYTSMQTDGSIGTGARSLAVGLQQFDTREYNTQIPKIFTYIAILPPAYKQEMYFRLILTHEFGFKDFRAASMPWDGASEMNFSVSPLYQVNPPIKDAELVVDEKPVLDVNSIDVDNGDIKLTSIGVS